MRVTEIFYSLQGEGLLAGVPSVFVRLAGCPLRCKWCDTKYAWDKTAGQDYGVEQIVAAVRRWPSRFIVITGGEPMVQPELPELAQKLKDIRRHITIETAGIAYIADLPCELMSISPKLSNSTPAEPELAKIHEQSRLDTAVLGELIDKYNYQLKFVVDSPGDLPEIEETIERLGGVDSEKVLLMPQAKTTAELAAKSPMVAELCKQTGYTFCNRLQILLWGNQRRK